MRFIFFCLICLFASAVFSTAQEQQEDLDNSIDNSTIPFRGSIPEDLLRPLRGEAVFYPIDTVIGQLGRGNASSGAYSFAKSLAEGFLLGAASSLGMEEYLPVLESIAPVSFRLGGGKEEPDGAVSFLVRFIGNEKNITGELFVRKEIIPEESAETEEGEESPEKSEEIEKSKTEQVQDDWIFDGLILEDAKTAEEEKREHGSRRFDFTPYERFF